MTVIEDVRDDLKDMAEDVDPMSPTFSDHRLYYKVQALTSQLRSLIVRNEDKDVDIDKKLVQHFTQDIPRNDDSIRNKFREQVQTDKCQVCSNGDRHNQLHHIIPRMYGGPNKKWNLLSVCPMCHRALDNSREILVAYVRKHTSDQLKEDLDSVDTTETVSSNNPNGRPPTGLKFDSDGTSLVPNDNFDVVEKVLTLREFKASYDTISDKTGMNRGTVYKICNDHRDKYDQYL